MPSDGEYGLAGWCKGQARRHLVQHLLYLLPQCPFSLESGKRHIVAASLDPLDGALFFHLGGDGQGGVGAQGLAAGADFGLQGFDLGVGGALHVVGVGIELVGFLLHPGGVGGFGFGEALGAEGGFDGVEPGFGRGGPPHPSLSPRWGEREVLPP